MRLLTEFGFNFVETSYSGLQTQYMRYMYIRRTQFMGVIQEHKTYFVCSRLNLPHVLGDVVPAATSCHINYLNINGVKRKWKNTIYFKVLSVQKGALIFRYERNGWNQVVCFQIAQWACGRNPLSKLFFICIYYLQSVFYLLGMSRGIYNVFSFTNLHSFMYFPYYTCCLILFCYIYCSWSSSPRKVNIKTISHLNWPLKFILEKRRRVQYSCRPNPNNPLALSYR
jgi:hypothetical protein